MKRMIGGAVLGWLSLFAVNFTTFITGVSLPVSLLSLLIAGFLGIPGVTLMVLLGMLL
ncbi:MAG: pro-sigmaK processing inhibitor BofA family protein [Clostridia bacterium]|nr:pro-sigmaK processing inhibitor BofA family protein [Clostridia bacterium]